DDHGEIVAVRGAERVTSELEDVHGVCGLGTGEEDDLVGGIGLDKLETVDVEGLVRESGSQCALDVVKINEQAVNLDIARTTATDSDGAVCLHAANIVGVKKHIVGSPGTEHVCGSVVIVEVVGRALAGDEAYNTTGAFLRLRDNGKRFVKENEVSAALSGTERNDGRDGIGGADEHL
ncbi:hypothetical protein F5I97DRAFT_1789030, partial [Phlebopus sp. FC_14]